MNNCSNFYFVVISMTNMIYDYTKKKISSAAKWLSSVSRETHNLFVSFLLPINFSYYNSLPFQMSFMFSSSMKFITVLFKDFQNIGNIQSLSTIQQFSNGNINTINFNFNSFFSRSLVHALSSVITYRCMCTLHYVMDVLFNSTNISKKTAMILAIMDNNIEEVTFLINRGENIFKKNDEEETLLHYAAKNGCLEIAELLINHGANPLEKNKWGESPLHYAVKGKHLAIAQLLIHNGANVLEKDIRKMSPLHYAVKNRCLETAQLLIDNGANVSEKDKWQESPLHYAAYYGYLEMAQLLIHHGASVTGKNIWGESPLFNAVENRNLEITQLLIDNGANTSEKNIWEISPLHITAETGYLEIAQLLLERGANIAAKNDLGESVIDIAKKKSHNQDINNLFSYYNNHHCISYTPKYFNDPIADIACFPNEEINNGLGLHTSSKQEENLLIFTEL